MKITNVKELRNELCELFSSVKEGRVKPPVAVEMNNSAGKILNSCKIELEYSKLLKKAPSIPFLDV